MASHVDDQTENVIDLSVDTSSEMMQIIMTLVQTLEWQEQMW